MSLILMKDSTVRISDLAEINFSPPRSVEQKQNYLHTDMPVHGKDIIASSSHSYLSTRRTTLYEI